MNDDMILKYFFHIRINTNIISAQSEEDVRFIELVLSLFKNLLTIPDPTAGSNAHNFPRSHMQDDLLIRFKEVIYSHILINITQGQCL